MTRRSLHLRPYRAADQGAWDELVGASRNATFLFHRAYCEYHASRFQDASWTVWDGPRLLAGLPACRLQDEVASHAGLTYGGFFLHDSVSAADVLGIFEAWLPLLAAEGVRRITYKPLPAMYHRRPSEDDRYALFRMGFRLAACGLATALQPGAASRSGLSKGRKWCLGKARKAGLTVAESRDFEGFMAFEREALLKRHGVVPVHSGEEMARLAEAFPGQIRLFEARSGPRRCAGVLVYDTGRVAHAQYISADAEGLAQGATDLLLHTLITETFQERRWFDFGISTEAGGTHLNEGLLAFKEGFGGSALVYETYERTLT